MIHLHSGYGPAHYDLMLQHGEALATWQLSTSPLGLASDRRIKAKKLKDHRIAYLTYEGPISKSRGRITMLDSGTYELISADERRWEIQAYGRELKGKFVIEQSAETAEEWSFSRPVEN